MGNFFSNYRKKKADEDADFKKRNPDNLPTKIQLICKIVVGGYLLYLVYKLYRDGALQNTEGGQKLLMIAAMVLFTAAGIFFIIRGFRAYQSGKFFDPNKDDYSEEAEEEDGEGDEQTAQTAETEVLPAGRQEEEAAAKPGSMASLAKLTSASTVSEEEQEAAYEAAKAANEAEEAEAAKAAGTAKTEDAKSTFADNK